MCVLNTMTFQFIACSTKNTHTPWLVNKHSNIGYIFVAGAVFTLSFAPVCFYYGCDALFFWIVKCMKLYTILRYT